MLNKICVYTCITGNYDNVNEFSKLKDKEIDYYLFTNNKNIVSNFWNVVYIENDGLDNIRLSRKIKILGHEILDKYEVSVYIDGSSFPKQKISKFLNDCCDLTKYSLIGFKHQKRDCIYDEAKACVIHGKDKKDIIKKQISFLKKEKYPQHNGLMECAVFVKKNQDKILKKTMKTWFNMVKKYSYRDQLSFNYAAYTNGLKFNLLNMSSFNNDYFGRKNHIIKPEDRLKKYRIYFGNYKNLDEYDYNLDFIDCYKKENECFIIEQVAPCNGNILNIRLDDIGGIKLNKILIKNFKHNKIEFVHAISFYDEFVFVEDNPTIIIKGKFKKDDNIRIIINAIVMNDYNYKDVIKYILKNKKLLEDKNTFLRDKNQTLELLNENLMNSNSWKITKPIRIISSAFKKILRGAKNGKK